MEDRAVLKIYNDLDKNNGCHMTYSPDQGWRVFGDLGNTMSEVLETIEYFKESIIKYYLDIGRFIHNDEIDA